MLSLASAPAPSRWLRLAALDVRSLALFRIGLALLVLGHLGARVAEFSTFVADDGVWPVAAARAELSAGDWSLHLWSGARGWQVALALAEGAAALALLVGWHTRVAVIAVWVLVASAQLRTPMIISAAGGLLRQFLFWGMWLPLGARWSLDARRRPALAGDTVISGASAALLLQLVIVYWANACMKNDPVWRTTGEAIGMVLQQETYARPLGQALLAWPGLLRALTHATFWLEALGPGLLFIPWRHGAMRLAAAGLFLAFHAGLAATLRIGLFPAVCAVGWLLVLPGRFWTRGRVEAPQVLPAHPLAHVAALAVAALMVAWNLRAALPAVRVLDPAARALRLPQRWAMFAPRPRDAEAWLVLVGTDAQGRETDLWSGASPVDWKAPADFARFFPSDLWKLYILNVDNGRGPRAPLLAAWLARRWQRAHPTAPPPVRLELFSLEEPIAARGAVPRNYLLFDSQAADP